ncbi:MULTISPECIES: universal stress protein [unclassified Jeotgalibaca]|uniref:universal stress protein n=1 Tax=unclassified Jeotgalibaca TaxID=2621505 RepID=UPI003FD15D9B
MRSEYKNILVPVDGSEQAEHSFKTAVEIAKRNNAKLHILYVVDTRNVSLSPEYQPVTTGVTDHIDKQFIEEMAKYATDAGVTEVQKTVTNGNPLTLISEAFPKEFDIDLIVIGATGKGAITRALVGSVSQHVVKHAPCDVLVAR